MCDMNEKTTHVLVQFFQISRGDDLNEVQLNFRMSKDKFYVRKFYKHVIQAGNH